MMKLFSEDPNFYLKKHSDEFEKGFMDIVKRRFMRTNINANKVYNEYIHSPSKDYVHLNSTKWATLSSFIMHLKDKGLIKII